MNILANLISYGLPVAAVACFATAAVHKRRGPRKSRTPAANPPTPEAAGDRPSP